MLRKYASIIRTLAFVIPAICIIGGIYLAIQAESVLTFVYFAVPALLYYVFTRSYAEMLESTEHTEEMLYSLREQLSQKKTAPSSCTNGWTCSCGRNNPLYTSTCVCGKSKNDVV